MKTNIPPHKTQGSVLLVTLAITGILGLTLASYLSLIGSQNRSVVRSQNWNSTIPVAEAGIEEAIVHLNQNCAWSDITREPVNWNNDGWSSWTSSDGILSGIQMTRWLGDSHYEVTVVTNGDYSTNSPGIFSKGYVPALATGSSSATMFAAIGVAADAPSVSTNTIGRQVRVKAGGDGVFTKGMVAKDSIDLNGNNVSTDSFDSQNPAFSDNGRYPLDSSRTRDNGDIAVNNGLTNSLNVGNANIAGSVSTGPGGSVAIGPNGKVGDKAWIAGTTTGIQSGHSRDDMNVSFQDVKDPFRNGPSPQLYAYPETVTNEVVVATSVTNFSATYPTGPGTVYTNTATSTSTSYPASGTYLGSVLTNTSYVTASAAPAAGTYIGTVMTNTAPITSSNAPIVGTYVGTTGTNLTTVTTPSKPDSGTYIGSITTNTVVTTTPNATYPDAGTYVGAVVANTQGNGDKANSTISYTYNRIVSYTYQKISGYSYEQIAGYSFNRIAGYTYALITGYYQLSTTYTTNAVTSATYDYVLDNDNYKLTTIGGKVLVKGNVILYVTEDFNFSGQDEILILPGASLKLYMGGSSANLGGNGVINNGGNATNFFYYGLPSNTDLSLGGNAAFTGVIYAPEADFTLNGSGTTPYDFIGASVTKTVRMNGHFKFHYDEALGRIGPTRGYVIQSWDEIKLTDNQ